MEQIIAAGAIAMTSELTTTKMVSDDMEFVYKLYCQNNAFIDEYIADFPILDASKHLGTKEFNETILDENVVTLILINKKLVKQHPYSPYYLDEKCGFLSYEKNKDNKIIKIIFWEVAGKLKDSYIKLLQDMIKLPKNTKNYNKIQIEIEDGNDKLMSVVMNNGFKEVNFVTNKNSSDIYIFEKSLRGIEYDGESDTVPVG